MEVLRAHFVETVENVMRKEETQSTRAARVVDGNENQTLA